MGPYGMKRQTKRASRKNSQAEWREIGYREYVRWRDHGDDVNKAFRGAVSRASGWSYHAREPEIMRFEARYRQDAIAEATRQVAIDHAQARRQERARVNAEFNQAQGQLFVEVA